MGEATALTFTGRQGPLEATLRGDDHALGHVAQHRVRGLAERPPRARARRRCRLLPDHLAPQQQPEIVLEDGDHVGAERPIRLAAEVRDVHRDPAAGLEHPSALGEHVAQHLQVVEVGGGDALADLELVVLADEVGRRGDHEGDRVVG